MFPQKHTKKGLYFALTQKGMSLGIFYFVAFGLIFSSVFAMYTYTRTLTGAGVAYAATSDNLNFQGRLLNSSGSIVPDGYYNIEFKIFDASSSSGSSQGSCTGDANCLWTETYYDSNGVTAGNDNRVRVVNGYFSVSLGSLTSFGTVNWDQEMWLTMNIGGSTQTATPTWDGEMTPRTKLTAVPYAFRAGELMDASNNAYSADDLVQLASGTVQTDATNNISIYINKTSATGSLIQLQRGGTDVFRIGNGGTTLFRNASDTTTSFQVQNAAGTNIFNIDTSNSVIGTAPTTSASTNSQNLTILSGNASGSTSNSGNVTIDAGTATGTAGTLSLGTANASAVSIGRSAVTTTITGSSLALNTDTITSNQTTVNLLNTGVTTVNAFGAATTLGIGATAGTINLNGGVTLGDSTSDLITVTGIIQGTNALVFEGSSADANETTVAVTNPTADRTLTLPDETGTICTTATGGACSALGFYIQNQSASDQTADFRISGTGRANTSFTSPLFDSITGALSLGTSTATSVSIGGTTNTTAITIQGAAAATYTIGTSNNTGGITVGNSTASNTINIGTVAGNGNTQTINIGTSATAGSTSNITLGSSIGGTVSVTGPATVTNRTSGSADTFAVSNSTSTGTIAKFSDNSTAVFTIADGGSVVAKNQTDGTTAFQVQNASASEILTVDTTNSRVYIGDTTADSTGSVLVLDTKNTSGDPTGLVGAMYYNSNANKFRCYENSAWTDCIGSGSGSTLQGTYDADADGSDSIITLSTADDSLIFRNPASSGSDSTYILTLDQLSTGAKGGLDIQSAGTGNLLRVTDTTSTSADVLTIADGGATTFKSQTNSTSAFQVNDSSNTNLLNIDSTNGITSLKGSGVKISQNITSSVTVISDDFNRTSLGSSWTQKQGTYDISSNKARITANAGSGNMEIAYYNAVTIPTADYSVSADISFAGGSTAATNYWGVAGRRIDYSTNDSNGYLAVIENNTGQLRMYRRQGAGYTQLGSSYTIPSYSSSATYNVRLTMSGTSISTYLDGVLRIGPVTDSNFTAAGEAGLTAGTGNVIANMTADNFLVTTTSADSATLLQILNSTGSVVANVNATGQATFKSATNSTTAFQIQNSSSSSLFVADTTNLRIQIGSATADSTGVLLVLDTKNTSGDPTGVNGGMYYNSSGAGDYRCYADGYWDPCGVTMMDRYYNYTYEFMDGDPSTPTDDTKYGDQWRVNFVGSPTGLDLTSQNGLYPSANHPGVWMMTGGTGSSTGYGLILGVNSGGTSYGATYLQSGLVLKSGVAVRQTTGYKAIVGINDQTNTYATGIKSGVWFEADPGTNANWRYCYGNGTTSTCANSTVAITADAWVSLQIRVTALGSGTSAATFIINGNAYSVSSVTIADKDAGGSKGLAPGYYLLSTDTTSDDMMLDYFQMYGPTSARR